MSSHPYWNHGCTNKHGWKDKLTLTVSTGTKSVFGTPNLEKAIQGLLATPPWNFPNLGPNAAPIPNPTIVFEPGKDMLYHSENHKGRLHRSPTWTDPVQFFPYVKAPKDK